MRLLLILFLNKFNQLKMYKNWSVSNYNNLIFKFRNGSIHSNFKSDRIKWIIINMQIVTL